MIYEIINPSDPYTIESDDFALACVVVCVLGNGMYGLESEDGTQSMPLQFFGPDPWFKDTFGKSLEELLDTYSLEDMAHCFDSVLIGKASDRRLYYDGLALIDGLDKRQQWRDRWHDERRSSLNDIGGRAYDLARQLREKEQAQ